MKFGSRVSQILSLQRGHLNCEINAIKMPGKTMAAL